MRLIRTLALALLLAGCQSGPPSKEAPDSRGERRPDAALGDSTTLAATEEEEPALPVAALRRLPGNYLREAVRAGGTEGYFVPDTPSDPEKKKWVEENCGKEFGVPRIRAGWRNVLGHTTLIVRKGYVLLHGDDDKIPLWVCEKVTKNQVTGNLPRDDAFAPDPLLPVGRRAELSDYKGSGFDRGHMAPAGNQTRDSELKRETFFLSNMVPQVGRTFNQGVWKDLESRVRDWAVSRSTIYTITGPMLYDPEEENATTAHGHVPLLRIGANHVAVPTHCFKIVVAKNAQGQWEASAFVLKNTKYRPNQLDLKLYLTSIRWIEERTGLDFLSLLPDDVEEAIEKHAQQALWN